MVCDKLSRPKSDSERDAAVGDCIGFGQAPHVAISPLGWRCIQIVHVLDDVRFHWVPLRSDSGSGNVEVLKKRLHQDSVTQDVTVIHLAVVRQASVLLQRMPWVMSTGELFWPTKLGICRFLQSDRAVRMSRCSSAESVTPSQGRVPATDHSFLRSSFDTSAVGGVYPEVHL